jgi:hypothetical protein
MVWSEGRYQYIIGLKAGGKTELIDGWSDFSSLGENSVSSNRCQPSCRPPVCGAAAVGLIVFTFLMNHPQGKSDNDSTLLIDPSMIPPLCKDQWAASLVLVGHQSNFCVSRSTIPITRFSAVPSENHSASLLLSVA